MKDIKSKIFYLSNSNQCVCQCFFSWVNHLILSLNKKPWINDIFSIFFRFLDCSGGFSQERTPKLMDNLIFWAYWTKNQSHRSIRFDELFSYSITEARGLDWHFVCHPDPLSRRCTPMTFSNPSWDDYVLAASHSQHDLIVSISLSNTFWSAGLRQRKHLQSGLSVVQRTRGLLSANLDWSNLIIMVIGQIFA